MTGSEAHGRVRVETSPKRVRAYLGGEVVADSKAPLLVWEIPYFPTYYFPAESVKADLVATGETDHSPSRGDAEIFDVKTSRATAAGAAKRYASSLFEELRDAVRLEWELMDEWFEEDEPVYTHPRDPYSRVDIVASSRNIRVVVGGKTVADSRQPRALFETGLPTRWYLPLTDIRMDLLNPSDTVTHCPYKGSATYWNVEAEGKIFEDIVWCYRAPLPESQKIAGFASFYNEKVDIYIDGELEPRPHTKFS
jgi:uncharacterized protein (DUF427 family)